jgi:hypothetical protein
MFNASCENDRLGVVYDFLREGEADLKVVSGANWPRAVSVCYQMCTLKNCALRVAGLIEGASAGKDGPGRVGLPANLRFRGFNIYCRLQRLTKRKLKHKAMQRRRRPLLLLVGLRGWKKWLAARHTATTSDNQSLAGILEGAADLPTASF